MKYSLLLVALLSVSSLMAEQTIQADDTDVQVINSSTQDVSNSVNSCDKNSDSMEKASLTKGSNLLISVTGQGVAPMNTTSPAQAYALAKRAAIADAYRMIAEKVKGVRVDGQDLIKNMMVKRSTVRTEVQAMVKNANIVETTFKDGLCEVEMEIVLSYSQFAH